MQSSTLVLAAVSKLTDKAWKSSKTNVGNMHNHIHTLWWLNLVELMNQQRATRKEKNLIVCWTSLKNPTRKEIHRK
ncbi:hypothetical protein DW888_05410 [Bacteroides nordii]|uniref:Uncharacterized protein n=1 Tax=Bacteroides nordii TaxID=291645 RepID=A0A413VTY0_9BACE|nr:hypothetical protein DW888_05410 [Bacteroides nordii]